MLGEPSLPTAAAVDIDIDILPPDVPNVNLINNNSNKDETQGHLPPPPPAPLSKQNSSRRDRRAVTRRTALPEVSPSTQVKLKSIYGPVIDQVQRTQLEESQRNLERSQSCPPNALPYRIRPSSQSRRCPPPAPAIRLCPISGNLVEEFVEIQPSPSPPPMTDEDVKLWITSRLHEPSNEVIMEVNEDDVKESAVGISEVDKKEPPPPGRDANLNKVQKPMIKTPECFVRLKRLRPPISTNTSENPSQASQESRESQRLKIKEEKLRKRASHYTFSTSSSDSDDDAFVTRTLAPKASRFSPPPSAINGHHQIHYDFNKTLLTNFRGHHRPPAGKTKKNQDSSYVPKKAIVKRPVRERPVLTRSTRNGGESTTNSAARRIQAKFLTDDDESEKEEDKEEEDEDLKRAILLSKRDAEKKLKMEEEAAKLPCPPSAPPLTEVMITEVIRNFGLPSNTKITTKFTLTIRQGHLALFKEREWLEDPNIDFYLEMIRERNENMRMAGFNYPKICVFHSFFFKFCSKNEFEAVRDFTNDNIFDCDLALFPILIRDHWRLIVADFNKKTLFCYDSLFRVNDQNLQIIQRYLERAYNLKREMCQPTLQEEPEPIHNHGPLSMPLGIPSNSTTMSPESEPEQNDPPPDDIPTLSFVHNISELDTLPYELPSVFGTENQVEMAEEVMEEPVTLPSQDKTILMSRETTEIPAWEVYFRDWRKDTLDPIQTPLPQQKNGSDCGIFLCQYAESLARGIEPPFDFGQVNMLYFRYLMAYETIHGELMDRSLSLLPPPPPLFRSGSLSPPPTT